jgi:hypothetical protein
MGAPDSALPVLTIRWSAWRGQKSGEDRAAIEAKCRVAGSVARVADALIGHRSLHEAIVPMRRGRVACQLQQPSPAGHDAPWAEPVGADGEACTRTQPFSCGHIYPDAGRARRGSVSSAQPALASQAMVGLQ